MSENLAMVNEMEQEHDAGIKEKELASPLEDVLPKVGMPFMGKEPSHAPAFSPAAPTTSPASANHNNAPFVSTSHLLNEYLHYFAPKSANEMEVSAPVATQAALRHAFPRSLWVAGFVSVLLIANMMVMLFRSSDAAMPEEQNAMIEFEHNEQIDHSPTFAEPPLATQEDAVANEYDSPALRVPKRRVLVISEQTRKELLEQLEQMEEPAPAEERYDFYRK